MITTDRIFLGVGEITNSVEGNNYKENLFELAEARPRFKCDVCGNTDKSKWELRSRKAKDKKDPSKEYKYVEIICFAKRTDADGLCWAKSDLGSYQDGKGNYWKKFERFEPEDAKPTTPNRTDEELAMEDYMA